MIRIIKKKIFFLKLKFLTRCFFFVIVIVFCYFFNFLPVLSLIFFSYFLKFLIKNFPSKFFTNFSKFFVTIELLFSILLIFSANSNLKLPFFCRCPCRQNGPICRRNCKKWSWSGVISLPGKCAPPNTSRRAHLQIFSSLHNLQF